MTMSVDVATIARDPLWLPHRHDPGHDAFHLLRVDRDEHRRVTFLNDDYLAADLPKLVIRREELIAVSSPPGPLHFIFHSAYCCSTLLARAFDLPGIAMGLKEPMLVQDMVGWRARGGDPARIGTVLAQSLGLLSRPMRPGEATVMKPSNIVNGLAAAMLAMRPRAGAVLLYAPLRTYLGSIARKEMWGRLWVRELFVRQVKEGMTARLGFDVEAHLGQTDLQIAALGWLAQHAAFADLAIKFGPERVRTLDSETLMARPAAVMAALARLFGLAIDHPTAAAIAAGPAFTRHSKSGTAFGADARAGEQRDAADLHGDEIDKVAHWAETVATGASIRLALPSPLLA